MLHILTMNFAGFMQVAHNRHENSDFTAKIQKNGNQPIPKKKA